MIPLEEMPDYRPDLKSVAVEFPPLDGVQTGRHPEFVPHILEYLANEFGPFDAEDLMFLRSAQVAESRYWVWEFEEDDGTRCYAIFSEPPSGGSCITADWAEEMTPAQAILADYHSCY